MASQSNKQLEIQLMMEWLKTLPAHYRWKTHVRVGAATLTYNGEVLSTARRRAFGVWSDWCDARVFTASEVWLVEAKIVGVAAAYGQLYGYMSEYPTSDDYQQFRPAAIRGFVLAAFVKPKTRDLFSHWGIGTILFTPSWAGDSLATRIHRDVIGE